MRGSVESAFGDVSDDVTLCVMMRHYVCVAASRALSVMCQMM